MTVRGTALAAARLSTVRVRMKTLSSPSASPVRTPSAGAEDTHRLRIRSIASLVEIAREVQSGARAARLRRQILMAAMGLLDARAGGVFRTEPDGRARLVEILGARAGLRPGVMLPLAEGARLGLQTPAAFLALGDGPDAEPWRAFARDLDPGLVPRAVFRLEGGSGLTGFIVLADITTPARRGGHWPPWRCTA